MRGKLGRFSQYFNCRTVRGLRLRDKKDAKKGVKKGGKSLEGNKKCVSLQSLSEGGRAEAGIREPERVIRRKIIDKTGSKYNKVPRTRLTRALIPQEIAAGSLQREILIYNEEFDPGSG